MVPGSFRDYRSQHPSRPVLLVEVADSTLIADRRKAGLYARAGVPEYWIVNLVDDVVEVYRRPGPAEAPRSGWAYAEAQVRRRGESLAPMAAPAGLLAVEDLLG